MIEVVIATPAIQDLFKTVPNSSRPAKPPEVRAPAQIARSARTSQPKRLHLITCYTVLRALFGEEIVAMRNQNITLSLPEEDLREARILAASRGTSVSQLLARMLRELVDHETGYARARDRSLARLSEAADLGTGGRVGWSRDSVHER
jgi:hypothetical protein